MKLTDGAPSAQVGMMGFSPMPKTPPKPLQSRPIPECGLSPDSRAGVGMRRGCGSAGSSTVSSSTSGPGARGGATGRSSSGTPSMRSSVARRVSTPVSRPLLSLGGLLGSNSFHTEYREQMSPSWWLGAAACSSCWLQLSPPPEVMELVEKKKLTEQFKTVEGLIDRARNRKGEVQAQPPPRHANCIVNPVNLWLRFLTLSPPLYAAHAPMAAVSPKTPQTGEHSGGDSGWAQPQETGEVQEYCLGSPGEQFLPILFEDSGGAAECVPPEELITFEEDALREVASHIEAKLAHALSCMVLAAAARTKAAAAHAQSQRAGKGSSSAPAASPTLPGTTPVDPSVEEEPEGPGGSPTAISAGRRSGPKRRRPSLTAARRGSRSSSPLRVGRSSSPAHKPRTAVSAAAPGAPGSPTTSAAVRCPKVEDPSAAARAEEAPKAPEAPDNDGVLIELEDLFATYGPSPSLLRHPNCFQKTPDLLRQQLY
ncbi:uncharacterized protein EMH_0067800 [Eimeria mitis]|uniref:Uncharacterized protein n=1 Tax=Eimeria mitis TaxID=44415 RepID=U6KDG6_9EIME|nr:uncharacterized protein EMH_0067800 [Eimeria mitis]CDJ34826.1 hypothetical protein, conserved [Eimeria mitis]